MALAVRVVAGQHHDSFDATGLEFRQRLPGAGAHRVGDEDHADEPVVSGNLGRRAPAVVDRGVERDPPRHHPSATLGTPVERSTLRVSIRHWV